MTHIEEALIKAVESRCKFHFPCSHLLNGSFHCQSSNTQATYRNTLIGTYNFNANQLIGFIQDWVNSSASVKMDWYSVNIDKHCPIAIGSLTETECGQEVSYNGGNPEYDMCVEHLQNEDIANCFHGCIFRNG